MKSKSVLILMRHGESMWNKANLFTGWIDIPLSKKGVEESLKAGEVIKDIPVDVIFMSSLIRSQMSAMLAMSVRTDGKTPVILHDGEGRLEEWSKNYGDDPASTTIPVVRAWELNERMYGQLQGLNKSRTIEKYGAEQVQLWRRSYDVPPPGGESLQMTAARSIPYFQEQIIPHLKNGKNVFVAAHGNSLRSIVMVMEGLTEQEVLSLELDTGKPLIYGYENETFSKEI